MPCRSLHVVAGGRASAMGAAPGTCSAVYATQPAWGQPPGAPRLQALPRCRHNAQARTRTQDGSACMGRTHLCTSPCTQLGSAPGAWLGYLRRQLADLADAQDSSAGLRNAVNLSREGDNASVIPFQQMGGRRTPGEAIGQRLLMHLAMESGSSKGSDGEYDRVLVPFHLGADCGCHLQLECHGIGRNA
ncbi:hypothetical protein B0H13DRAFT_1997182 [Mycena leptocephala]|nr:hypothetical protein B0H13DRAFT_1997182 [Mycena leptocephala]